MEFLKEIYFSNQTEINLALVGIAVAVLDKLIENSKLKSNNILTVALEAVKNIFSKKK